MSVRSAFKKQGAIASSRTLAAVILAGAAFIGRSAAAGDVGDSVSQVVQGVFTHSQGAVVKIEGVDNQDHSILVGTGFFVDPNGLIYTLYSVGGESQEIVVSYGGKSYPAKRLLGDPRSGIAILKIDAHTAFLPICKSNELKAATPVLIVGYPGNLPLAPSLGMVAGLDAKNDEGYFLTKHIRANVTVQPGQGGAPMLNLKGEVIGIVISGGMGLKPCYALPMEAAEKVRSDYVRFGGINHGVIGISVAQAAIPVEGSTVVVTDLKENTPAAKSGLQKGDVVLQIGEKKITMPEDVLDASFFLTGGDDVPVTVLRGNEKITVKLQPASDTPLNAGSTPPLKMQP